MGFPSPAADYEEMRISLDEKFIKHPAATYFMRKRTARTVLTGMCYSVGSVMRQGSSSLTRLTGQSAMTSRTWRR